MAAERSIYFDMLSDDEKIITAMLMLQLKTFLMLKNNEIQVNEKTTNINNFNFSKKEYKCNLRI